MGANEIYELDGYETLFHWKLSTSLNSKRNGMFSHSLVFSFNIP